MVSETFLCRRLSLSTCDLTTLQEAPNGDDKLGESKAGANEEQALTFQTSAESDHPINLSLKSNSGKSVTLEDRVEKSEKDAQVQEILVGSVPGAADMTTSTDSQEQWVEVSGGK